ncbi:MAG: eight-cysteine-cluster domain-containing protein [Candidatus Diapherotrites archaeon]
MCASKLSSKALIIFSLIAAIVVSFAAGYYVSILYNTNTKPSPSPSPTPYTPDVDFVQCKTPYVCISEASAEERDCTKVSEKLCGIKGGYEARSIIEEFCYSCPSTKASPTQSGFCGYSTYASCSADSDCVTGGCSGQICMGKREPGGITTCEWRDCYDETKYGLSCKCVSGRCQWAP